MGRDYGNSRGIGAEAMGTDYGVKSVSQYVCDLCGATWRRKNYSDFDYGKTVAWSGGSPCCTDERNQSIPYRLLKRCEATSDEASSDPALCGVQLA